MNSLGGGVTARQISVANENGDQVTQMGHVDIPGFGDVSGLRVLDNNGSERVDVGLESSSGDAGIDVFDQDMDPLVRIGDLPSLGIVGQALFGNDAQGNGLQGIVQSASAAGGKIELFNPAGTSTFTAP
jgi:hypothetical protein